MEKLSISLWVFIVLFRYSSVCLSCVEEERNGLLKFEAFAGNRNEKSDCCGWEGVKCDNTTRRVVRLNLNEGGGRSDLSDDGDLRHVLDASLFLPFPQLQYLDLSENMYSDLKNHQDLEMLKNLEVLILGGNYHLNDTRIIQSLSTLTSLAVLDISGNGYSESLSAELGPELCKLKNLQELFLENNQLSGSIPACFDNLTSLEVLDLSRNKLVGNIYPSPLFTSLKYLSLGGNLHFNANPMFSFRSGFEFQFGYLDLSDCNINLSTTDLLKFLHNEPKLLALVLANNNLYGEFPNSTFEENLHLKLLDLRNNSITGHIHLPVGHSVELEYLDVSYNNLHGELQPNLGYCLQKLRCLNIANNSFTGEIPTSIHAMKYLKYMDLSSNNLSGKLPERLDLSCERLEWINLSNNRLEGRIPIDFFNLEKLTILDLSNNQFSGHIPSNNNPSFGLSTLNLNQNRISGSIPSWLCGNSLFHLDLSENQLSGPLPSCLITMPYLNHLYLQHNKLTGPFPKSLPFNTTELLTLDVSDNNLSGKIPNWFGFLLNLEVLLLKGNRLSGSIPHELCSLQKMGIMDISHNILSGSIPFCFNNITFGRNGGGTLSSSEFVNDYHDIFKDMFADLTVQPMFLYVASLDNTNNLKVVQFVMKSRINSYERTIIPFMFGMDLSCNNLEGNIPLNIGDLTELRALNLSHNRFTGVIPSSMSNLKQIESLDLSHNKLSGEIPSNLTRLSFLVTFDVAYNNLSGRLPEMSAQFSTFNDTSYEGNPLLCGPPLIKQCNIKSFSANTTHTLSRGDKFGIDRTSFLASFTATYATFLLAFVIVLCINPHWRRRWFYFIDVCISFVFPFWSEAIHRRRI